MSTIETRRAAIRKLAALYKDKVTGKTQWCVKGNKGLAYQLQMAGWHVSENMVNMWIQRGTIPRQYADAIFGDKRGRAWRSGLRPADVCKQRTE